MTWRALDGVFFLRPLLLVPVWTIYLLGFGRPAELWPIHLDFGLGLCAINAACAAAFVLNQIFDMAVDRDNRKCPFLTSGAISVRTAWWMYALLCAVALVPCFLRPLLALPTGGVLLLGVLYSAPPFSWKNRPYLALAANLTAHGVLVFACGRLGAGAELAPIFGASLPYAFGVAAVYLLTTLPDREGDAAFGKRTLAVLLGPERVARWALGWTLSAVLLALYQVDVLFLCGSLPSVYWFVRAGRGDLAAAARAARWSVLGVSAAACVLHPWYALVLGAGFWLTRVYYRERWALTYP